MSPWRWSDLDPFYRDSALRRAGRELDPTSKKSAVSQILDAIKSLFPEGLDTAESVAERIQNIAYAAANTWASSHQQVHNNDNADCIAAASSAVIYSGNNDSEIKKVLDADGGSVAQKAARVACDFALQGRR